MSKVEISMIQYLYFFNQIPFRGVARGGARGARASPEFGRSVNPIQTRGGGQTMPLTLLPVPRIQEAIYTSAIHDFSFNVSYITPYAFWYLHLVSDTYTIWLFC
jgi:hypothetical protein